MYRMLIVVIGCFTLGFLAGCEQINKITGKTPAHTMSMDDMKKPSQPVQMRQLDPFIGEWSGTAQMVVPADSPAATQQAQTFKGGGVSEYTLDGMAMKSTGWHEMLNGQRETYVEYVSWDPKERKFRSYYVSDWGNSGTGWMWADPSGQTFHWSGRGVNAHGESSSMSGTSTLIDRDTMEWRFVEHGPMGRLELKGTSKRTSGSATK